MFGYKDTKDFVSEHCGTMLVMLIPWAIKNEKCFGLLDGLQLLPLDLHLLVPERERGHKQQVHGFHYTEHEQPCVQIVEIRH